MSELPLCEDCGGTCDEIDGETCCPFCSGSPYPMSDDDWNWLVVSFTCGGDPT